MITDYTPGEFLTYEEYELVFDDGHNNGFAFPCDESGHLLSSATEAAVENYLWCMAHPDDFVRWNRILWSQAQVPRECVWRLLMRKENPIME